MNQITKVDSKLRPIPDFPDYYVDKKLGNVWSFMLYGDGRILKPRAAGYKKKTKIPTQVVVTLCKNGKKYTKNISRLIMNVTDPKVTVDHKDRNIWHNERSNLRIATRQQQSYNRAPYSKTGFKGIAAHGSDFVARIWLDGKFKYLGIYSNILEAAAVSNIQMCKYHDDFVVYNKVDDYILTL